MNLRFLSVIFSYFPLSISFFILFFSYLLFSYRTLFITVLFNRTDRLSCINIRVILTIILIIYYVQAGVGYDFLRGLILKMHRMSGGVEILRHRTDLLCKSCQTILGLKQIHVSFKRRQKNALWRFFVSNKTLRV